MTKNVGPYRVSGFAKGDASSGRTVYNFETDETYCVGETQEIACLIRDNLNQEWRKAKTLAVEEKGCEISAGLGGLRSLEPSLA